MIGWMLVVLGTVLVCIEVVPQALRKRRYWQRVRAARAPSVFAEARGLSPTHWPAEYRFPDPTYRRLVREAEARIRRLHRTPHSDL